VAGEFEIMTNHILAIGNPLLLVLQGHWLAYEVLQPAPVVENKLARATPVDVRAKFNNEYVTIHNMRYDRRSPLENPHWLAYFRYDGFDVRVDVWGKEFKPMLADAGYVYDLDDMRSGDDEPVWIPVLLEWCSDNRLRVREVVNEKVRQKGMAA
jgi:hypothetical protein